MTNKPTPTPRNPILDPAALRHVRGGAYAPGSGGGGGVIAVVPVATPTHHP